MSQRQGLLAPSQVPFMSVVLAAAIVWTASCSDRPTGIPGPLAAANDCALTSRGSARSVHGPRASFLCGGGGGTTPFDNTIFALAGQDNHDRNPVVYQTVGELSPTWYRAILIWKKMAPTGGTFDTAYLNTMHLLVDSMGARGINVYFHVMATPPWAQHCMDIGNGVYRLIEDPTSACAYDENSPPSPDLWIAWQSFTGAMVREFAGAGGHRAVTHWAFGNEPNDGFMVNATKPDRAAAFALATEYLADAVHSIPGNKVLGPELASGGHLVGDNEFLVDFIVRIGYKMDIITAHAYSDAPGIRAIALDRINNGGLLWGSWPLWLTEVGEPSPPDTAYQASFVYDLYSGFLANPIPRVQEVFYFNHFVQPGVPDTPRGLMILGAGAAAAPMVRPAFYCYMDLSHGGMPYDSQHC